VGRLLLGAGGITAGIGGLPASGTYTALGRFAGEVVIAVARLPDAIGTADDDVAREGGAGAEGAVQGIRRAGIGVGGGVAIRTCERSYDHLPGRMEGGRLTRCTGRWRRLRKPGQGGRRWWTSC
jgi:hypothetical protein